MTIRTVQFGGSPFSDGEVLYGADLNDTFQASSYRFLGSINGTSFTGTNAVVGSFFIGAGSVTSFASVILDYSGSNSSGTVNFALGFAVGSPPASETMKKTAKILDASSAGVAGTYNYIYVPSSTEKANGFSIKILGSITSGTGTVGSAYFFVQ